MNELKKIKVDLLKGNESFFSEQKEVNFNLLEFWRWNQSDLLNNARRGSIAEFIVCKALDCKNVIREEWDSYDLETSNGIRLEVKSSAYLQSWDQKGLSKISFDIAPKKGWDAQTNIWSSEIKRWSDYYVFCLLEHKEKVSVNPLNLSQWKFFLVETSILNQFNLAQKSISLNSLLKLKPTELTFEELNIFKLF